MTSGRAGVDEQAAEKVRADAVGNLRSDIERYVPEFMQSHSLAALDSLADELVSLRGRVEHEPGQRPYRLCLNVSGEMLCDGPQDHDGGCTFQSGWNVARKLEDELLSTSLYAGDTTNELRDSRAELVTLRDALEGAADALERIDAAIETNSEEGTPDWLVAAGSAARAALHPGETT